MKLDSAEPHVHTWMARVGPCVIGSVSLVLDHEHMATIRGLSVVEKHPHCMLVRNRLLEEVASYARDHSILKLRVHHNSAGPGTEAALSRMGFHDAGARASTRIAMQFYLDLYHQTKKDARPADKDKQLGQASVSEVSQSEAFRLAC